jgi:chromosome partitioning protein
MVHASLARRTALKQSGPERLSRATSGSVVADVGRIAAIANQKGGVGKTTTAINLAVALGLTTEGKILLIDLDPQGNSSSGLISGAKTPNGTEAHRTIYEVLSSKIALGQAIRQARERVFIAPSGADLVGAEIELATVEGRERRLKQALDAVKDEYEWVLIDTPPSLGLLTLNAMVAADGLIVPMQCEYYALEGLSALLGTIKRVKGRLNPALEIIGIVLTMFDSRNRLSHEIAREVHRHFPDKTFESVIPRSVRISESPSHALSVIEYDGKSAGAEAYRSLAAELTERVRPNGAAGPAANTSLDDTPGRKSWSLKSLFAREKEKGRKLA